MADQQERHEMKIERIIRQREIKTNNISAFFSKIVVSTNALGIETKERITKQVFGIEEINRYKAKEGWDEQVSDLTSQINKFNESKALADAEKEIDARLDAKKRSIAAKMAELAELENGSTIEDITKSKQPTKKKSTGKKSPGRPSKTKKPTSSAAGQALKA